MTVRNRSRMGSARRGLAVAVASAVLMSLAPGAAIAARSNTDELSAADNVGAALAWSQYAFDSADAVAVGRDDVFADSLSSGLIQGLGDGVPLLLTASDELDADVSAEIERLGASAAHILGGESAISADVETALEDLGLTIHRHAGVTRVETAIDIASKHATAATTAILARSTASGTDETQAFADSLAAGAWAAESGFPILLTQSNELNDNLAAYLDASSITDINVVGGTSAVAAAVVAELESMGITVERISGATRFETATAIAAARGFADAGDATDGVILVDGQDTDGWASGFAAAAFASNPKPVVLSNGADLPEPTTQFLEGGDASTLLICGASVPGDTCDDAAELLGQDVAGEVSLTATSVATGDKLEGTVSPATDVTSVAVSGPCVTDGAVTLTNGAFSIPVTGAAGDCTVTFTVTHSDGNTTTQTFGVTVTAPATVMDEPELVSATLNVVGTDHVSIRYKFDQAVTGQAVNAADFSVVGWDGVQTQASATTGYTGQLVRIDPGDNTSVIAVFSRAVYDNATTATVENDAVRTNPGDAGNPEAAAALQTVSVPGGTTIAPDLTAVGSLTNHASDTNKFTAQFTFDEAATMPGAATTSTGYVIVLEDGTTIPATTVTAVSGLNTTTHTVTFDVTDASASVSRTDAVSKARRGYVNAAVVQDSAANTNERQSAAITGNTTVPYVTGMSITQNVKLASGDQLGNSRAVGSYVDKVELTWNEAVTFIGAPGNLTFYEQDLGNPAAANANDIFRKTNSDNVIVVYYDRGVLDQVVGMSVDSDAVQSVTGTVRTNRVQEVDRASQSFAGGNTIAPDLGEATRTVSKTTIDAVTGAETASEYTITLQFDDHVNTAPATTGVYLYNNEGTRTQLGTLANVTGPTIDATDPSKVTYKITNADAAAFKTVGDAIYVGILEDAAAGFGGWTSYEDGDIL